MFSFSVLVFVLVGACGSLGRQADDADGRQSVDGRLDKLERYLHRQDAKVSSLEKLVRQMKAEDSRLRNQIRLQDDLIRQLLTKLSDRETPLPEHVAKRRFPNGSGQPRRGIPSTRGVTTRSDDWGTLEAVVNQVSQKVTEMDADIQAYKAKTSGDIQALQTQTSADIQTLKANVSQQAQAVRDAQSSTFIQWGSSSCGSNSQLVYSGVVGGSYYNDSGAATNHLCLTMSPVLSSHVDHGRHSGYLYGGEYQTHNGHGQEDPVCAVCRSAFTTTVMIPGTNVCTPGWHLQYKGYLMAGSSVNAAGSEYICVDSKLESRSGSSQDEDGVKLFFVNTRCGSLPCSPYVNSKVVTCAVCSK